MNENLDLEIIKKEKVIEYLEAFGLTNELENNEKKQFVEIATAYNLNPFKREVFVVAYGKGEYRKLSIITGYETYLKRAERIGVLNGWCIQTSGEVKDNTLKAIITIHRKDWVKPFVHEVFFKEYNQNNKIWREKPITMIRKVCTAQGFRLCFPDELGGMPYTSEELPEEMTTVKKANIEIKEKEAIKKIEKEFTLQKGDFTKAKKIIHEISDFDNLKKINNFLDKRSWESEELLKLDALIKEKKEHLEQIKLEKGE